MGLIEGVGTEEATWRHWLPVNCASASSLPCALRYGARLVVLAPHPDDEVLACGGLLSMHAASGGSCLVIGVTDGEASEAGLDSQAATSLAAQRRAERQTGLARLGAENAAVELLGLPDGGLADCVDAIDQALQRLLAPGDVLMTTWRHDGHPDHEACAYAAARANTRMTSLAGPASSVTLIEAPVWMWHWSRPDDPRVPWLRLVALDVPQDVRQRKEQALSAHCSQLLPRSDGSGPVLGPQALARMQRGQEHYFF